MSYESSLFTAYGRICVTLTDDQSCWLHQAEVWTGSPLWDWLCCVIFKKSPNLSGPVYSLSNTGIHFSICPYFAKWLKTNEMQRVYRNLRGARIYGSQCLPSSTLNPQEALQCHFTNITSLKLHVNALWGDSTVIPIFVDEEIRSGMLSDLPKVT